eukprot:359845-Chlamydomonas_euryale.AAC.2
MYMFKHVVALASAWAMHGQLLGGRKCGSGGGGNWIRGGKEGGGSVEGGDQRGRDEAGKERDKGEKGVEFKGTRDTRAKRKGKTHCKGVELKGTRDTRAKRNGVKLKGTRDTRAKRGTGVLWLGRGGVGCVGERRWP